MARLIVLRSLCFLTLATPIFSWVQNKTENKPPDSRESNSSKVTVGDVSYVVVKSSVTGDTWSLIVEATSKRDDQKFKSQVLAPSRRRAKPLKSNHPWVTKL